MCPQVTKTYTMEDLIVGCDHLPSILKHNRHKGSCAVRKAMKVYECPITGETIHIGDSHRYLTVWDRSNNKRYAFHLSMSVPAITREKLFYFPELSEKLSNKKKRGFFNA